jgi:hypothetical protein
VAGGKGDDPESPGGGGKDIDRLPADRPGRAEEGDP